MDFSFDENQRAVAELAAEVLSKEYAGEELAAGEGVGEPGEVWAAFARVGLLALALDEELGGDGLGMAELVGLFAEVGRKGADVPVLATLALGVLPVTQFGTAEQRARILPDVATGEAVLTGAVSEPGDPLTLRPAAQAQPAGSGWVLTGSKIAVPYAHQASVLLVPACLPGGSGVFLVDPHADGVGLTRTPSASGAPEYSVTFDGVTLASTDLLGEQTSETAVGGLRSFALAGAAALGDGILLGALDLTTEHVRTRHQFGKPLASFQAVSQQVADVYIASRTVHLAALSAAWRLSAGLDAGEDLDVAAYWLTAEALPAVRTCHHLHGGIGVDVTYPLHRHYSGLKDLTRFLGGQQNQLEELGGLIGGAR